MESNQWQNNPNDPRTWGPPLSPAEVQQLNFPQPGAGNQPLGQAPTSPIVGWGPGVSLSQATLAVARSFGGMFAGSFIANLVFLAVFSGVWVCLYPLSALSGLLSLRYLTPFLNSVVPLTSTLGPTLAWVVAGPLAAGVVVWNASRFEHVLAARSSFYRIPRHWIRLPLLGLLAVFAIQRVDGFPITPTLAGIEWVLKSPTNLAIVVGAMVASHFVLWNWTEARNFWHRRLAAARLMK